MKPRNSGVTREDGEICASNPKSLPPQPNHLLSDDSFVTEKMDTANVPCPKGRLVCDCPFNNEKTKYLLTLAERPFVGDHCRAFPVSKSVPLSVFLVP